MEESDLEATISRLKSETETARREAKDYEDKMMKAALYGKDLLDRNIQLEAEIEKEKQDKYEINLRLQAKSDLEQSLNSELESLRENLKAEEKKFDLLREEDGEKTSKREEELSTRLTETEQELDMTKSAENRLKELVQTLEKQLEESNSALNKSVHGESFSNECEQLHQEKVELLQEKQSLELELTTANNQASEYQNQVSSLTSSLEEKECELESVQVEISSYSKTIDSLNLQLVEVQGLLDAERNMAGGEASEKGNSLFSEVEDRRQAVEDQLSVISNKYNTIKENYDVKIAELQKVKMHNSQLLSIAGGGGSNDSEHVGRLEEMLGAEKKKVRDLMDKLDQPQEQGHSGRDVKSSGISTKTPPKEGNDSVSAVSKPHQDESLMDTNESVEESADHLQSKEYKYMAHMLEQANNKHQDLKNEVKRLVREGVDQSDKQQELSRQLHTAEVSVKKLKSENYALRIELDTNKTKVDNSAVEARKPENTKKRRIVEQINFNQNTTKENQEPAHNSADNAGFTLKETIAKAGSTRIASTAATSVLSDDNDSATKVLADNEMIANTTGGQPEVKKRRGIKLSDQVEEIDEDGSKVHKSLQQEVAAKAANRKLEAAATAVGAAGGEEKKKGARGAGRKHTAAEVKKGEVQQECKQQ